MAVWHTAQHSTTEPQLFPTKISPSLSPSISINQNKSGRFHWEKDFLGKKTVFLLSLFFLVFPWESKNFISFPPWRGFGVWGLIIIIKIIKIITTFSIKLIYISPMNTEHWTLKTIYWRDQTGQCCLPSPGVWRQGSVTCLCVQQGGVRSWRWPCPGPDTGADIDTTPLCSHLAVYLQLQPLQSQPSHNPGRTELNPRDYRRVK